MQKTLNLSVLCSNNSSCLLTVGILVSCPGIQHVDLDLAIGKAIVMDMGHGPEHYFVNYLCLKFKSSC